jgi:hypothetical protein
MEMIAMLGGLSTGSSANPMELGDDCVERERARILAARSLTMDTVARHQLMEISQLARAACAASVQSAGVTVPAATSPSTVKLISVFAVGAALGFFFGRGTR